MFLCDVCRVFLSESGNADEPSGGDPDGTKRVREMWYAEFSGNAWSEM